MERFRIPIMRKFLKEELGQTAVVVALTITSMLALAGASVDVGHIYYAYRLLVSSTNAAALAGAQTMGTAILEYTSGPAYTAAINSVVNQYSSTSGGLNASSFLQNDSITTTSYCSSTMQSSPYNVVCEVPPGSTVGINAIKVTQTAQVNLWFGGLIGITKMNLWATSSAAMRGGFNIPYNLAVIMDTTQSMSQSVSHDPNCTTSQITCAVSGFKTMLENMYPCTGGSTCTSSTPYVDDVALFVFPAVSTTYSGNNYSADYCASGHGGGSSATSVPYNFINVTPGTNQNLNMENSGTDAGAYEIVPFNDLYKTSDTTQTLATGSSLAEAVGVGCTGLGAPGGQGTYYAQAIYQAQAALVQAQNNLIAQEGVAYTGSKNVMIILTDGDATASASSGQLVAENNPGCTNVSKNGSCLNGTGTSSTNPEVGSGNNCTGGYQCPAYPSALGMCGQAVQAAHAATAAGTIVYTIGFGSESSGCTSDQTYTVTSTDTDGAEAWPGGPQPRTPCNAIAAMASSANTFYSDNTNGCPALIAANSGNSLNVDFEEIVAGLTSPRLIPSGTP